MTPTPEESLAADLDVVEAELDLAEALEDRDVSILAAELDIFELETEIEARTLDRKAGRVPAHVTRALFPHEIASQVDFGALDEDRKAIEAQVSRRLSDDRRRFLELLAADLADRTDADLLKRLGDLDGRVGYVGVAGARDLVKAARQYHRDVLAKLAVESADRVIAEAQAQGVPKAETSRPKLDADQRAEIDRQALRLAEGPLIEALRTLRERAYLLGAGVGK